MNANESLYIRKARQHVGEFDRESQFLRDHQEAMNCLDCDAFLQMGVDAFDWLIQTDRVYRKVLYDDQAAYNAEFEATLVLLFRALLSACDGAEPWIASVIERGYQLDNLSSFHKSVAELRGIVRFYGADQTQLPDKMRALRDQAIGEHRNGQTAEFV
jgi:hypothetical protein